MPNKKRFGATAFQLKTCWSALTGLSIYTLIALACLGIYIVIRFIGFMEPVLIPIVISGVLAYLLEPVVVWLCKKKIPRPLSVVIVMVLLVGGITALCWTIIPPLVEQINQLIADRMRIWTTATQWFDSTINNDAASRVIDELFKQSIGYAKSSNFSPQEIEVFKVAATPQDKLSVYLDINSSKFTNHIFNWISSSGSFIFSTLGLILSACIIPLFVFFFLQLGDRIALHWHEVLPIRDSKFKDEVVATIKEINGYLISFFRGQLLVSIIEGILIGTALKLYGLPYAFTIGVFIAILGIIPYLGIVLSSIPALIIAGVTWGDFHHVFVVALIITCINQFDNWIVHPKIVGDSVGLHPFTVIVSALIWSMFFGGLLGALLAVPLTASIKVLFSRYIWQSMKYKKTYPSQAAISAPTEAQEKA